MLFCPELGDSSGAPTEGFGRPRSCPRMSGEADHPQHRRRLRLPRFVFVVAIVLCDCIYIRVDVVPCRVVSYKLLSC